MFRLCFVGLVAGLILGLMSFLPIVGVVFEVLAVISLVVAGLSFIIGLIKILFFGWW